MRDLAGRHSPVLWTWSGSCWTAPCWVCRLSRLNMEQNPRSTRLQGSCSWELSAMHKHHCSKHFVTGEPMSYLALSHPLGQPSIGMSCTCNTLPWDVAAILCLCPTDAASGKPGLTFISVEVHLKEERYCSVQCTCCTAGASTL